jgi:hypothetical protein
MTSTAVWVISVLCLGVVLWSWSLGETRVRRLWLQSKGLTQPGERVRGRSPEWSDHLKELIQRDRVTFWLNRGASLALIVAFTGLLVGALAHLPKTGRAIFVASEIVAASLIILASARIHAQVRRELGDSPEPT